MLSPFSIWKMESVRGTFLKATSRKDMGRPRHGSHAKRSVPARLGSELRERSHAISSSNRGCANPSRRRENPPSPPLEKGGKELPLAPLSNAEVSYSSPIYQVGPQSPPVCEAGPQTPSSCKGDTKIPPLCAADPRISPFFKGGLGGICAIAPCPPSDTHMDWRWYHRLLLHSCPVWLSALVLAGCMITSQSLVENSQQPEAGEYLIKPVIADEANDNAGAPGPTSAPTVRPEQQEIASPVPSDQRVSSVSQQAGESLHANEPSNRAPQESGEALALAAQPAPMSHRLPASGPPGANTSPDLAHSDASVRAAVQPASPAHSGTSVPKETRHSQEPKPPVDSVQTGPQAGPMPGLQTPTAHPSDGGSQSKLVRAPEAPARSGEKPCPASEIVAKSEMKKATQSMHVASFAKEARQKSGETQWEDQKVKQAAMELRDAHRSAQKMKLCYAVKDDEWWVIFYEDAASHYELRQYVWDRDRERLDPFLVMKRIPRDRLKQDLSDSEPDRACEVVDLASPPQQEDNGLNANF